MAGVGRCRGDCCDCGEVGLSVGMVGRNLPKITPKLLLGDR
ncbi:hypothetical protein [Nostoc sp.]